MPGLHVQLTQHSTAAVNWVFVDQGCILDTFLYMEVHPGLDEAIVWYLGMLQMYPGQQRPNLPNCSLMCS